MPFFFDFSAISALMNIITAIDMLMPEITSPKLLATSVELFLDFRA